MDKCRSASLRVLVVFGTRPEAIKMSPLVHALRGRGLDVIVCVSGQHREMLDQVLDVFEIVPDVDLGVMNGSPGLHELASRVVVGVGGVVERFSPDLVLVHGDTLTSFAAATASYLSRTRIGHVEAGLRTADVWSPWPEEGNRRAITTLCDVHFAPTALARENLLAAGIEASDVFVTGNTVIDALVHARAIIEKDSERYDASQWLPARSEGKRVILVTGHRRENFGVGMLQIASGLRRLAARDDVHIVYPVHLNPAVSGPIRDQLGDNESVTLLSPMSYLPFVSMMMRSSIILTDSGGIQEEAPSLGKPVLVMRDRTERSEAVDAGSVRLVGAVSDRIVEETERLLDDSHEYDAMATVANPYGDGLASDRIVSVLIDRIEHGRCN